MSKKNICIYASELAIITGDNSYQSISSLLLKIWQRACPKDYIESLENIKKNSAKIYVEKETAEECIKRLTKENKIDIKSDMKKCLNATNLKDMLKKQDEIIKKCKDMSKKDKKTMINSIKQVTHTSFGTVQEGSALDQYQIKTGTKVLSDQHFYKKILLETENISWYVGGKIDGITEDRKLIEVKNRMYKLFYTVRSYEKIQIMSYLHIFELKKAHLVESLKKKSKPIINIICVDFDKKYFDENIINPVKKFSNFFNLFLKNPDFKTMLLFGNEDEIDEMIWELLNKD